MAHLPPHPRICIGAFRDALSLCYTVCNHLDLHLHLVHAVKRILSRSCSEGGFTISRHNEIRDLNIQPILIVLTEICSDVCIEPELQPMHKWSN